MHKIIPKSVQTCFEDFLGWFFRKNFLPSVPWWVESSKIFKKVKKVSKFQKCPKSFQKVSQRVLNKFRVDFFEKFFVQCSMEGRVFENFQKNQKFSKIPKMPKIVPKSVQTCFENVLGRFFPKKFLPSVPWRVESPKTFEKIKKISNFQKCPKSSAKVSKRNFSKTKKNSKIQTCPKSFPKVSKRVLKML